MAQLFSLGHIHTVYYYDTYVCSFRTSGRGLVYGDSDNYRHFHSHGFCFPVALEYDDAAGFSVARDYVLAGISAFVACQPTIWW